ncbi:MAG: polysaccharide lyase family 7 protein, partial [Pirellulaceae bacterium]|nr:polysaccharide lyase family 7 protein [Pirellulaceae bacterium]
MKLMLSILLLIAFGSIEAAELPSSVLDLSSWKLTLPEDTSHPGNPDERFGQDLLRFRDPRFFCMIPNTRAVSFRAPCGGATTRGSKYPRCELREMKPGGRNEASWDTADGKRHTLVASLAILEMPAVKKH